MPKFAASCSDVVALARANFSIVHLLNLGAAYRARFVECGTSASVSLDVKLRIYFGKNANPMVLHFSGMCVSHRDTPVSNENTTYLQPSPSRLQVASLREDGRAHTIHLFVFKHMCLDVLALARTKVHLSPDGRLWIYFGKNANHVVLHVSGMCVCHDDIDIIAAIVAADALTCV